MGAAAVAGFILGNTSIMQPLDRKIFIMKYLVIDDNEKVHHLLKADMRGTKMFSFTMPTNRTKTRLRLQDSANKELH